MPASGDGFAVSSWPLHRAGGEAAGKRGVFSGTEPAGPLHQLQTYTVQLPKTLECIEVFPLNEAHLFVLSLVFSLYLFIYIIFIYI